MFKLDMPRTHRIEASFSRAKQEGMEQAKMQDNARWELQSIQNARMQNKSTQFDPARRADASRRKKKNFDGLRRSRRSHTPDRMETARRREDAGGYANDEGYTRSDFRTELTKSLGIGQNPRAGGEAVHAPERAFGQPEIKVGQNP